MAIQYLKNSQASSSFFDRKSGVKVRRTEVIALDDTAYPQAVSIAIQSGRLVLTDVAAYNSYRSSITSETRNALGKAVHNPKGNKEATYTVRGEVNSYTELIAQAFEPGDGIKVGDFTNETAMNYPVGEFKTRESLLAFWNGIRWEYVTPEEGTVVTDLGTLTGGNAQAVQSVYTGSFPEGEWMSTSLNTASLLLKIKPTGNVIATQDGDGIRLDMNWNGEFENPQNIPATPGAVVTRFSLPKAMGGKLTPLIVSIGDVNATGIGANNALPAADLLPRASLQIFNPSGLAFEPLKIGQNNQSFNNSTNAQGFHGYEQGLATSVEQGKWNYSSIYYVNGGWNNSISADWANNVGNVRTTQLGRANTAKAAMLTQGLTPAIMVVLSLGAQDANGGVTTTVFKANLQTVITQVREALGFVPIAIPYLPDTALNATYDYVINELILTNKWLTRISDANTAAQASGMYYSTPDYALFGQRIGGYYRNVVGQGTQYLVTSLNMVASPATGSPMTEALTLIEDKTFTAGGNGWNIINNNAQNASTIVNGRLYLRSVAAPNAYSLAAKDYLMTANKRYLIEVFGVEKISGNPSTGCFDGNPQPLFSLSNGYNKYAFRTTSPITAGTLLLSNPQPDGGEFYAERIKLWGAGGYNSIN